MKSRFTKILITDDDEGDRKQITRAIGQSELAVECTEAASMAEALAATDQCEFDCAIVDYRLPGYDGLETITALRQRLPDMAVIMSTGQGSEGVATEAMKRGAADYISKSDLSVAVIQRAIENALQKSALQRKIKQQQEELENFARVLVHDLRAPAASIEQFAIRIQERLATGNPQKALEYVEWVIQSVQRMKRLIATLHEYTTASEKVVFGVVDMNQALDGALANLSHLILESGAHVTSEKLPPVMGSAPQLIQLLQNLIGNSIKYCDRPQARIHIRVTDPGASACFAAKGDARYQLFCLKDNGIGIPEGAYNRIFEPFTRLSKSGGREGTGLGLATCKKIVERHQGAIWCESKPGEGSTFFFTLPSIVPEPARSNAK